MTKEERIIFNDRVKVARKIGRINRKIKALDELKTEYGKELSELEKEKNYLEELKERISAKS